MENEESKVLIHKPLDKDRLGYYIWDEAHTSFLEEHIDDYTNAEFSKMFCCSKTAVVIKIQKMGLRRSMKRKSELSKKKAAIMWDRMNEDPEKKKEFCRRRNILTTESNKSLKKSELFRINRLCLPQKTRWKLVSNRNESLARHHLKKYFNYMVNKESKTFYYDELTKRCDEDYYSKKYNFKFIEAKD